MSGPVRDKRFLKKAIGILEDKKVEDIRAYDLKSVNPFVDFTLVGTCQNPAQMNAVAGALHMVAKESIAEGEIGSGWVVVDVGRVVVHVLSPTKREFYRLDQLWEGHFITP